MEAKMHVPVDRQTCHVIPDTNQTARLIWGVNSSAIDRYEISSLTANACKDITKQSAYLTIALPVSPHLCVFLCAKI
ncbi:MAG: hypothetical protein ACLPP9_11135 [Smithella sp.]